MKKQKKNKKRQVTVIVILFCNVPFTFAMGIFFISLFLNFESKLKLVC